MPASMIMAETGGSVNEIGSSIATVVTGPIPGSTPTTVPRNTPMKQYAIFCHVSATLNPSARFASASICDFLERRPDQQRQAKPVDKHADGKGGEHGRQHSRLQQTEFPPPRQRRN